MESDESRREDASYTRLRQLQTISEAALDLAGQRLAIALDHSRLFQHEQVVAETLQRSLLWPRSRSGSPHSPASGSC